MVEHTYSDRPVVIQKFGGTSVSDDAGRQAVVAKVMSALDKGLAPVIVVSAMGREGSPYATDTLLSLLDTPDKRERDRISACGEIISAAVLADVLRSSEIPAQSFSGPEAGILTTGIHGDAKILAMDAQAISATLLAGIVPVVAGFQGISPEGELTTLGRGGSDTTACALGVALDAELVEIHTDVEGVMTADPKVCDDVTLIDVIRFEELFQMARHGAKVVHAPAAKLAMGAGIPLRILSTFSSAPGTLVTDAPNTESVSIAVGVTHLDDIVRIRIALPEGDTDRMSTQTRVFTAMARAKVSLDMFTPCGGTLAFCVGEPDIPVAETVLHELGLEFQTDPSLAKVTLVGAGMHGVPGVMARIASALERVKVDILQIADSHTTISVLICQNKRRTAVIALHETFGLDAG